MNYSLVRPCEHCPFRTDCLKGWLGRERAEEIAEVTFEQDNSTFPCHETTQFDDQGECTRGQHEQHCAGAMILMEKRGRVNQMLRIAERLRLYDRTKIDMDAPVFDTVKEFIDHHTEGRPRKRKKVRRANGPATARV